MRDWIRLSLAWDGLLPLLTTAIPFGVACFFPGNDGAAFITVFTLPMFAALLRASIGYAQIQSVCGGRAPALRQTAMAAAITLLMLVDAIAALWILTPLGLRETILPALVLYAGYLLFVSLALAPSTATRGGRRGSLPEKLVPPSSSWT